MQIIIEDLEWQLGGADGYIETCEKNVEARRTRLMDEEKYLAIAVEELAKAINRKEELQQALEVLRTHESQEQS